ncbi:hypothetical protein KEM54_006424 [Ascosphaera aggregata]|nr:hypothetical protein KEM54_006424 [Ascosphaera aggregata]
MDRFAPQEVPQGLRRPNLLMTAQVELELQKWMETRQSPFPGLPAIAEELWERLSMTDLRVLHHIYALMLGTHQRGLQRCTPWGDKMFSWMSRDEDTNALADEYFNAAFCSFQDVIRSVVEEDVDIILATGLLLSWTCRDLRTFNLIQDQTRQVISRMKMYQKQCSELAMFIQGQRPFRTVRPQVVSPLETLAVGDVACLNHMLLSLRESCRRLPSLNQYYRDKLEGLSSFAQQLLEDLPLPPEIAFKRLTQLREWIFWYAAVTVQNSGDDYVALSVLCQFYCVALAVEPVIPEIDAMFSALVVEAMDHIKKMIDSHKYSAPLSTPIQIVETLMEAPIHVLNEYQKSLFHWLSEYRNYYESSAHPANYAHSDPCIVSPTTDTYLTPPLLSPISTALSYTQQQACCYLEAPGSISQVLPHQGTTVNHTAAYLETPEQENETHQGYNLPIYSSATTALHDTWL